MACLKWWINLFQTGGGGDAQLTRVRTELLNAAVLSIEDTGNGAGKIITLQSVKTFLNTRGVGAMIPTDGPLPDHLIPHSISRNFDPVALSKALLWKELSITEWLAHILDEKVADQNVEFDPTRSPQFAERVLVILSRTWVSGSLSKEHQSEIIRLMRGKPCIPSSAGLKRPQDVYFKTAEFFSDLPIVRLPSGSIVKGALEKVLQDLGVRKHVDLQVVFDRWSLHYISFVYRKLIDCQDDQNWRLVNLRACEVFGYSPVNPLARGDESFTAYLCFSQGAATFRHHSGNEEGCPFRSKRALRTNRYF